MNETKLIPIKQVKKSVKRILIEDRELLDLLGDVKPNKKNLKVK